MIHGQEAQDLGPLYQCKQAELNLVVKVLELPEVRQGLVHDVAML